MSEIKLDNAIIDGYSGRKLLSAMSLGGYRPTRKNLAEIMGNKSSATGTRCMTSGEFVRSQLMGIKRNLRLTDEEFCAIFFSEDNVIKEESE